MKATHKDTKFAMTPKIIPTMDLVMVIQGAAQNIQNLQKRNLQMGYKIKDRKCKIEDGRT